MKINYQKFLTKKIIISAIALIVLLTLIFIGFKIYQRQRKLHSIDKIVRVAYTQQVLDLKKMLGEEHLKIDPSLLNDYAEKIIIFKTTSGADITAAQLISKAQGCGTTFDQSYLQQLAAKFGTESKVVYNFKYQGNSQDGGIFALTLLPNKAGYTSLEQFKKDFAECTVGGDLYPLMLNNDWLVFDNSCSSENSSGCATVKKIIEPGLKLE